jgi:hypothetical protein
LTESFSGFHGWLVQYDEMQWTFLRRSSTGDRSAKGTAALPGLDFEIVQWSTPRAGVTHDPIEAMALGSGTP